MRGSKKPSVTVFSGVLGQPQAPGEGALVRSLVHGPGCRGSCGMRLRGRGGARAGAGRRNTCDRGVTASQRPGSAAERPGSGGMRAPATWGSSSRHDLFLGFHLSDLGGNLIREEWSVMWRHWPAILIGAEDGSITMNYKPQQVLMSILILSLQPPASRIKEINSSELAWEFRWKVLNIKTRERCQPKKDVYKRLKDDNSHPLLFYMIY